MIDMVGAKRKIRQARFFLHELDSTSSRPQRGPEDGDHEILEFYFSACLTAAQSAYYVLDETGGPQFKEVQTAWRDRLGEPTKSEFGRTIGLRDDDVHFAVRAGHALPRYVKEDPSRYTIVGPTEIVEKENPDGSIVRAPVLRGAIGLYLTREGRPVEATRVCREFIERLGSLADTMRTATIGAGASTSAGPKVTEERRP